MTTHVYRSAFATESTHTSISRTLDPDIPLTTPEVSQQANHSIEGSLASFICRVAYLENELRAENAAFFDSDQGIKAVSRVELGSGASFSVERGDVTREAGVIPRDQNAKSRKYIAIKRVKGKPGALTKANKHEQPNQPRQPEQANWTDILLEIRALLHEPLRYHPNIVRLLSLGWGSSRETGSIYPTLVMEYATFGSMHHLQSSSPPLPFRIKQKLCYDVARGLSIIHACGIVHGDLKHENVLVFENRYDTLEGQPYTAKLADFGGAVMDIAQRELHFLRMGTFPYDAPEAGQRLDAPGIKKTDVYSFGMLVWRAFIDGRDIIAELGLGAQPKAATQERLRDWKIQDELLIKAINSVESYASTNHIPTESTDLILYSLNTTIRADPTRRDFTSAQSRLRGMSPAEIEKYLPLAVAVDQQRNEADRNSAPGRHGMTVDTVGYALGKLGDDYDAQNNLPGFRTTLSQPEIGGFLFEPSRLKKILDWDQQEMIVEDLRKATQAVHHKESIEPPPWKAAYYLFQCYLTEFGVAFDAENACHWLYQASKAKDEGDVDYWAQAWLWRVSTALSVPVPLQRDQLLDFLRLGLMRGHRNCLEDGKAIVAQIANSDEKRRWESSMDEADWALRTIAGGVGMPHYAPRKMRRLYDLMHLTVLDDQIREELGEKYDASLRRDPRLRGTVSSEEQQQRSTDKDYPFDKIYVNHKGHGLLHYAASVGNLTALRHLVEKYFCDIDLANESLSESPLVCASRAGNYDCAVFLLDHGANANGTEFGQEAPLHWLCSMQPEHMAPMAKRLMDAGADLEKQTGLMRKDVRMINADWEDIFGIPVTPLGRAVLMRSLPAIKALLDLGADPLGKYTHKSIINKSAVELAAVLTLPHILEVLLSYVDEKREEKPQVLDDVSMLKAAHEATVTEVDSTTLHSRLIRCGTNYKTWMFQTLQILHDRQQKLRNWTNIGSAAPLPGMQLCWEVRLGNVDIVESLLALGHDPNGSPGYKPIEEAVLMNHDILFRVLINHGARITTMRRFDGWMHFSLLQLLAARPRTSRAGNFIAEYLIRAGVALEPLPDGTPSALILAIKNRYFDLADLLIAHGAEINVLYQVSQNGPWGTVLKDLLQHHSYASLESINYLFKRQKSNQSTHLWSTRANIGGEVDCSPAFIVDQTNGLSALHILARCSPEVINHKSQISASMMKGVVEAFESPEKINYQHPTLGTALCIAAMTGNIEMVAVLLEVKADITIPAKLPNMMTDSEILALELQKHVLKSRRGEQTPLALACDAFEAELCILESSDNASLEDLKQLKRIEGIIKRLQTAAAGGAYETADRDLDHGFTTLQERKKSLEDRIKLHLSMARVDLQDDAASKPINLGMITEEKPSGWTEGCEMTQEISLRVFLNYLRQGNSRVITV